MLYRFDDFERFKSSAVAHGVKEDLDQLKGLSILFFETYPKYMIIKMVSYEGDPNIVVILSKKFSMVYPVIKNKVGVSLSKLKMESKWGESTYLAYVTFRYVLEGYQRYFKTLDLELDAADNSLNLDEIERISKKIKKFRDLVDDFLHLLIRAEDKDIKFVDTAVLAYEFDLLLAQTRHLADRCRTAKKELNVIRQKCDVFQTMNLNKNIEKLTKIMMFLTIVGIVISVPNTIATIYGIGKIAEGTSEAFIWGAISISFLISIFLSFAYLHYYMKK
ncbi:MAG: CorA family divalent cation transporter [Candidatus Anstonellales archaeon]